ncbi:MAG: type III toxin-antitoxin system ToxN/AbiQ family toxin [Synergistaceae bacterium]|nr:type III toxin-antitoxin system ToxN/AbiQ family toxin [Synergistaceae bacterium]MBQ6972637.1 type III toxin-antitoxin system ToxN/AbiQ family toxin [Synergistaceae bacterium]
MNDSGYSLWFYNIDVDYIKFLHSVDGKVQYSQGSDYSSKPFLGGFSIDGIRYFVPLSSPKSKHIHWDYEGDTYIMIHETIREEDRKPKNVIRRQTDEGLEKILAILYFNNMIPAPEGCYEPVGDFINIRDDLYYDLLRKEYYFCLNIDGKIACKARKLHDAQKEAGVTDELCCDFMRLEKAMREYQR